MLDYFKFIVIKQKYIPKKAKMSRTQAKKGTTNYSKNSLKIDLN